jgi:hypothetical protein
MTTNCEIELVRNFRKSSAGDQARIFNLTKDCASEAIDKPSKLSVVLIAIRILLFV